MVATGTYVGEITAVGFVPGFRARNFGYPGRRAWLTEPEHGVVFAEGSDSAPEIQPYARAPLSDYALEIQSFADYVAGASEGVTTGRSERRSLAIVEAGYESVVTGQPVNLLERLGPL